MDSGVAVIQRLVWEQEISRKEAKSEMFFFFAFLPTLRLCVKPPLTRKSRRSF